MVNQQRVVYVLSFSSSFSVKITVVEWIATKFPRKGQNMHPDEGIYPDFLNS